MSATSAFSQAPRQEQPLLVVRPQFSPFAIMASHAQLILYLTVGAGSFCGGFFDALAKKHGIILPVWLLLTPFHLLAFFVVIVLVLRSAQRLYSRTEYRFYQTYLEYEKGLWSRKKKRTAYNQIADISCEQGLIQRRYALGTIVLLKSKKRFRIRHKKIEIKDVPYPNDVYEQVKALIHTT